MWRVITPDAQSVLVPTSTGSAEALRLPGLGGLDAFGATFQWAKNAAKTAAKIAKKTVVAGKKVAVPAAKRPASARVANAARTAPRAPAAKAPSSAAAVTVPASATAPSAVVTPVAQAAAVAQQQAEYAANQLPSAYAEPSSVMSPQNAEPGASAVSARWDWGFYYPDNWPDESEETGAADTAPADDTDWSRDYSAQDSAESTDSDEEDRTAYLEGLGLLMGENSDYTKAAMANIQRQFVGFVSPAEMLTAAGAARLGSAGAKAATAHKLAATKADAVEKQFKSVVKVHDALPQDSIEQKKKHVEAAFLARELLSTRVQAERARVIAGGAIATLNFRKQAQAASKRGDTGATRDLLGKAAAAVYATQGFAKTPIVVTLPAEFSASMVNALAAQVGWAAPLPNPAPNTAGEAANIHERNKATAPATLAMPSGQALPMQTVVPNRGLPTGIQGEEYSQDVSTQRAVVVTTLAGVHGANLGGFLDSLATAVVDVGKAVVPSNTIVGKVLAGNMTGAVAAIAPAKVQAANAKQNAAAAAKAQAEAAAQAKANGTAGIVAAVTESFTPQSNVQLGLLIGAGVLSLSLIGMVAFRKSNEAKKRK